jgi:FkbM family methyltransferase
MIVGLGNYSGGEVLVEGKPYPIRYNPLEFDGWNQLHWTNKFHGERFSLVWFTPELKRQDQMQPSDASDTEDSRASHLAKIHSSKTPFLPPLKYRSNSTDSLVIAEILDNDKGCAYTMDKAPNIPNGFSLKAHSKVLDVGAHIGVFSRYALGEGCQHIVAYEPEPSNFDLLSHNLKLTDSLEQHPTIELHSKAVTNGFKTRTLVRARDQNDGKVNTWRHSLSEYSQYVDRSTKLPSESQKAILDRVEVESVAFFGGALQTGVTFVKLDCEGAEIEILQSPDAANSSAWLDVTHLVVEWSFTKERRVDVFHKMLSNLSSAGFEVYYEGMGSWWDTDANVMWPYPNDCIVFARRKNEQKAGWVKCKAKIR